MHYPDLQAGPGDRARRPAPWSADGEHVSRSGIAGGHGGELELLRPEVRRTADRLAGLLHPGFFEFGASGRRWNRDQAIQTLTAGPQAGDDALAEVSDLAGERLAADVILLTYVSRRGHRRALRSSLWRKTNSGWQLYFHQGTPLPTQ